MFDQMAQAGGRRSARDAAVDRLSAVMDELSVLPIEPAATRASLAEVAVLERARSWASAQQSRVLAGLEVAEPADYDPDSAVLPPPRATTPQEIALVLRSFTATVRGRLAVTRGLVEHFPQTLAAAADGTVPWWQARRTLEETSDLSAAVRAAVDRDLAAHAGGGVGEQAPPATAGSPTCTTTSPPPATEPEPSPRTHRDPTRRQLRRSRASMTRRRSECGRVRPSAP